VQRTYTYGYDRVSQNQLLGSHWAVSFYGYDGQRSVRFLTDDSGAIVNTYTYDAFGNVIQSTETVPNVYTYVGEPYDAKLGLTYLRARYMSPATGRFWTMDPCEGHMCQPLSLNKYPYAHANPVNNRDPSGMFVCLSLMDWGNKVHWFIEAHFMRTVPGGLTEKWVSTLIGHSIPLLSRLRPDLIDVPKTQIYDIKSVLETVSGEAHIKLGLYLFVLNTFDTSGAFWVPGHTYVPPPVVPVEPYVIAIVIPPQAGVITYCPLDVRVVGAVAVGVTVAWFVSSMEKQARFAFAG